MEKQVIQQHTISFTSCAQYKYLFIWLIVCLFVCAFVCLISFNCLGSGDMSLISKIVFFEYLNTKIWTLLKIESVCVKMRNLVLSGFCFLQHSEIVAMLKIPKLRWENSRMDIWITKKRGISWTTAVHMGFKKYRTCQCLEVFTNSSEGNINGMRKISCIVERTVQVDFRKE